VYRLTFSPDGKRLEAAANPEQAAAPSEADSKGMDVLGGEDSPALTPANDAANEQSCPRSYALGKMGRNRLHAVGAAILIPRKAAPGQIVGLIKLD
jgi:hypothetical protein